MSTGLNAQEVYLLERYISVKYFVELKDTWSAMIEHVEICLDRFTKHAPPDSRSRPLPEKPDIVWGNKTLPNFRDTLEGLQTGLMLLSHGDFRGLGYAHGPLNDAKGQRECWSGWMGKSDENAYAALLNKANEIAFNIAHTEGAHWRPLSLAKRPEVRGPLNFPTEWPTYKIDHSVSVFSGDALDRSGIYLPYIESSCAAFLCTNHKVVPKAKVIVGYEDRLHPDTGEKYAEEAVVESRPCRWYLVERVADQGGGFTGRQDTLSGASRITAGEICGEAGIYFTPPRLDSRRMFNKGEIMPDFESAYGTTIWQREGSG